MSTRLTVGGKELAMCPNCLNTIAMALGGAGSAVVLAVAGLRFRTIRPPESNQPIEETAS